MHSVAALLPLLAFAASILAAPTPLQPIARTMPNLHEVIRNPTPVDSRTHVGLNILGAEIGVNVDTRAVPSVAKEIKPPNEVTG
ncbi:hypothetical protein CC86DRAFT_52442 [Ophiobolus disseminans]|uniref:Uncharacterized protein n=1 Tax=Ophiobolus disseminans TaxID=1469910 RepID=A0A6A6ZTV6_9PLEO|nr:hypothetical protein CC86DRAFT_52442 [Ophiobolus disseminans]